MLLSAFVHNSVSSLKTLYPEEEARAMVSRLCEDRLGVKSYTHIIEPETEIPKSAVEGLSSDLLRLESGEPIQYVLGHEDFFGRRFKVNRNVLIPRPETEQMVEEAIAICRQDPGCRLLDMCTGSGCIAWSLAAELKDAEVFAVDISVGALETAAGQEIEGAKRPNFVNADVLSDIPENITGRFDLIVSNPPYVKESEKAQMRKNVLNFEPGLALFVEDEDPLVFYRAIARWSLALLSPEGCGLVEINETLPEETAEVFRKSGFCEVNVLKDFRGKDRFVKFSFK